MMDAFAQPKMSYDPHSKAFSFSFDSKRPMNPPASGRCVRACLPAFSCLAGRSRTPCPRHPSNLTHARRTTQHHTQCFRARMFRERYQLVQQRVLRHELFTRPILGHDRQVRGGWPCRVT